MSTATARKQNPSGAPDSAPEKPAAGGMTRKIPESAAVLKDLDTAIKTAAKPQAQEVKAKVKQMLERCGCL